MLFAVFDPRVVPQEHYGQRFYHPLHRWEEPWSALQTPWSSPSFIQAPQREIYPEKSPFLTLSWESWANVRAWAANPPGWVEIHAAKQVIGTRDISGTDREAIALARELNASFLLMDDQQARRCARALEVTTLGTLGLLEAAAARGLVSLPAAIEKLRRTSFFVTDELIEAALQRDTERRRRQPT